jgi:hypothetical protein
MDPLLLSFLFIGISRTGSRFPSLRGYLIDTENCALHAIRKVSMEKKGIEAFLQGLTRVLIGVRKEFTV